MSLDHYIDLPFLPKDADFQPIGSEPADAAVWLRWAHGARGFGRKVGPFWVVCPMPGGAPLGSRCEDDAPSEWAPMPDPEVVAQAFERARQMRRDLEASRT